MLHILAAENNRGDARLLRMALANEADWAVDLAVTVDGEQTLDYLLRRPPFENAPSPDLLILDLNLPRLDGVEVLRWVRRHPEWSRLPVMILSSSPQEAIEERVHQGNARAEAYLTKPFDVDEFLSIGNTIRLGYYFWLAQQVSSSGSTAAAGSGCWRSEAKL